ncbi:helix-turn-helix transcriptional regulator [Bifidobacterium sp. W8115]|uniref:helix-turn-helix transcriptional regulator n=1 Tax=Bifidobacterium TaxID=1678 RepID=UPI0009E279FA|nr:MULTISPECIES: helix-turn-helix transcriptional regulator [Bifidobacterium]MBI0072205.1 helix-turn-helix transcriptional regulator [Bifidobacterium sp. W8112]MBI0125380.1 helix-turn-helix transcriptional regulator [Bifidobacterium apousia]
MTQRPATGMRRMRQSQNLTQAQLADKAGLSRHRVSDIESGTRSIENISVAVALRIAQSLDCTIEDLL